MKFTLAFGEWVKNNEGNRKIVVGRDARVSGEMVNNIVVGSLMSIGIDVVDLGLSTTPTVEIAVHEEKQVVELLLPLRIILQQWNALKLLNSHGEFISAKAGEELLRIAEDKTIEF